MAVPGTDRLAMTLTDAVADRFVAAITNGDIPGQDRLFGSDFELGCNFTDAAFDHARGVSGARGSAVPSVSGTVHEVCTRGKQDFWKFQTLNRCLATISGRMTIDFGMFQPP